MLCIHLQPWLLDVKNTILLALSMNQSGTEIMMRPTRPHWSILSKEGDASTRATKKGFLRRTGNIWEGVDPWSYPSPHGTAQCNRQEHGVCSERIMYVCVHKGTTFQKKTGCSFRCCFSLNFKRNLGDLNNNAEESDHLIPTK